MNRTLHTVLVLGGVLALAAGIPSRAAADDRWQLRVSGVAARSTAGGGSEGSPGVGLALEYRATPRFGVELSGLTSEVDELDITFFPPGFEYDTEVRITPVLAGLDVHLTPGRRADLYLGPVAGWVSIDDVTARNRNQGPIVQSAGWEIETDDQFAWGAQVGVDVQLGRSRRSFLSAGVTYLDLPLDLVFPFDGPTVEGEAELVPFPVGGDLDPLVVHLGYAVRF